jgi:flagellar hook protein FlgE
MNVVGNNIANVSTIGFKSQRVDFNDYLYVERGSTSGPTQVGQGVSIYTILGDYSQGSFESTNSATDIAIDGNGFFGVRDSNSKTIYYTRAGDFYFNADRELVNPEDMKVQGLRVDNKKQIKFFTGASVRADDSASPWVGQGTPTDIVLDSWNCIPQRTTNITVSNLLINDDYYDKTTSDTSPLTSLFDLWDATAEPPLPTEAYATQSSLKVYDESGTEHDVTIYFDKVQNPKTQDTDGDGNVEEVYSIEGLPAGYQVYEYLVTIPPSEDMRSYGGTDYNSTTGVFDGKQPTKFYQDPVEGTSKNAGILMQGVLIFNASGQLVQQTAYTYGAQEEPGNNNQVQVSPDLQTSWQPTAFSNNSLAVCLANFTGQPLANSVSELMTVPPDNTSPLSQAENYLIEIDFGLADTAGSWTNPDGSLADLAIISGANPPNYNLQINVGGVQYDLDGTTLVDNTTGPFITTPKVGTGNDIAQPADKGSYVAAISDGATTRIVYFDYDPSKSTIDITITREIIIDASQGSTTQPVQPAEKSAATIIISDPVIPYKNLATMSTATRNENATANNGSQFISDAQQDGYAAGVLNGYDIDTNGVVYGRYSNNVTLALWQITLYDFRNLQGLQREGGNLYSATMESGNARWSVPGNAGFGSTQAYNIEQSNVDMAREFVQMISTQRGFQANSKSITTVDTMLETVIGMKR